jgi:hypothetical protein
MLPNGRAKLPGGSGNASLHSRASRQAPHLALSASQPGQLKRVVRRHHRKLPTRTAIPESLRSLRRSRTRARRCSPAARLSPMLAKILVPGPYPRPAMTPSALTPTPIGPTPHAACLQRPVRLHADPTRSIGIPGEAQPRSPSTPRAGSPLAVPASPQALDPSHPLRQPGRLADEVQRRATPNGLELSCPAAQAPVHPLSRNSAGQSPPHFPHASRVSCSELLGGELNPSPRISD